MANHSPCSPNLFLEFSTLVDLLQYRASNQPDQIGYQFLSDGETKVISLSYQALDREARKIATQLQSLDLEGKPVILLYLPGIEFITAFFGCLYAGAIAVPAYPPQIQQNLSRLQVTIADSQATAILTTTPLLTEIEKYVVENGETQLSILTTDNLNLSSNWQKPNINRNTLAFIQYTSGSTGNPKGVMLAHGNLLHNSSLIYQGFEHSAESRGVIWLPPYHDMGLIGGIIQPLYGGFPVVLMSPVSFLRKPLRWLQAISRYQATTSGAPNFAYNLCVQKITPQQKATLDLSSWEVAFIGAETISPQTLERFTQAFEPCGFRREAFYACYGLAEATLFITGGLKSKPALVQQVDSTALQQNRVIINSDNSLKTQKIVSCGQTLSDQKVVIVDPESLTLLQTEQVGEIWVSGSSVAQGYWNQPEKTKATFQTYLKDIKNEPFLRTGDLGFLQNGELFVTGRLKDLIIIRGQNYYPQDLELTVEQSHQALRQGCCAAFSVDIAGEEQLVIVIEIKREYARKLESEDVFNAINSAISKHHGLQTSAVLLLKQGSIPKTSSGKIKRHSCKTKYQENSFNPMASWQKTATVLTSPNSPSPMSQSRTDDLIQWLRHYANEHINSRLIDERRCIPPYLVLDFGNQGMLGMQVPPEYGGLGLNNLDTMRILEQLGAIDPTLSLFVGLNNILGIRPLLKFGSQSLREDLLPILATGRELAAFALTETGAGSNPQAIASKAIRQSDGTWVLRGQKIWSGSAAWAGAINVFVQDIDTEGKSRGISGFVLRKGTKGLKQGAEALTMGMRGMVQNTVYLENISLKDEQRLGESGAGMKVAQDAMMYGRLGIAAACVGGMKRCAQLMLRYSERRLVSTGRLLDNPLTLARINGLTAAITAVEILVKTIAKLLDSEIFVPVEAYTACKIAAPEFYWQAADNLVQCLGGRGYIETNIAPQILRDARILRIFEGPTETLTMFLGSRVINQSEELKQFLCHSLKTPEIYDRLISDAQAIQDYYSSSHSPFSEALTAKRWLSSLIGEMATFAILLAGLKHATYQSDSETLQRAIAWTKQHLEQKLTLALSQKPDELVLANAQKTADLLNDYETSIGNIEQTLAGEDHELDHLLRKSFIKGAKQPIETSETLKKTHSFEINGLETEIQTWLLEWLSKKLKISAQSLDPKQSFADYGMDSVIAVELAQDLQDWLDYPQELEATIAWNFPTIQSLAQHLSELLQSAKPSNSKPSKNSVEYTMISQIQDFSEDQLQDSIAQEMAELESLLLKN